MTVNVQVTGAREVIRGMRNYERGLPKTMDRSSMRLSRKIQNKARSNVANRTFWERSGRLESSIKARPLKRGGRTQKWIVGPDMRVARYAGVVEEGQTISGWHAELTMKGKWMMVPGGIFQAKPMYYMRDALRGFNILSDIEQGVSNLIIKSFG